MDLDTQLEIAGIDCDQETVDKILAHHKPANLVKIANRCYYYGSIAISASNKNSLNFACAGDSLKATRHLLAQGHKPNEITLDIICNNNSYRVMMLLIDKFPKVFKNISGKILSQLYDFGYLRIANELISQCTMTHELAYIICMRGNIQSIAPYEKFLTKGERKRVIYAMVIKGDWEMAREIYDPHLNIDSDRMLIKCCKGNSTSIPWLIGIGARMDYSQWLPFRLLCAHNPDMAMKFLTNTPTNSGPSIHTIWKKSNGKVKNHVNYRNWDVGKVDVSACNYEAYRLAEEFGHTRLMKRLARRYNLWLNKHAKASKI
jgi:hypothetical protein